MASRSTSSLPLQQQQQQSEFLAEEYQFNNPYNQVPNASMDAYDDNQSSIHKAGLRETTISSQITQKKKYRPKTGLFKAPGILGGDNASVYSGVSSYASNSAQSLLVSNNEFQPHAANLMAPPRLPYGKGTRSSRSSNTSLPLGSQENLAYNPNRNTQQVQFMQYPHQSQQQRPYQYYNGHDQQLYQQQQLHHQQQQLQTPYRSNYPPNGQMNNMGHVPHLQNELNQQKFGVPTSPVRTNSKRLSMISGFSFSALSPTHRATSAADPFGSLATPESMSDGKHSRVLTEDDINDIDEDDDYEDDEEEENAQELELRIRQEERELHEEQLNSMQSEIDKLKVELALAKKLKANDIETKDSEIKSLNIELGRISRNFTSLQSTHNAEYDELMENYQLSLTHISSLERQTTLLNGSLEKSNENYEESLKRTEELQDLLTNSINSKSQTDADLSHLKSIETKHNQLVEFINRCFALLSDSMKSRKELETAVPLSEVTSLDNKEILDIYNTSLLKIGENELSIEKAKLEKLKQAQNGIITSDEEIFELYRQEVRELTERVQYLEASKSQVQNALWKKLSVERGAVKQLSMNRSFSENHVLDFNSISTNFDDSVDHDSSMISNGNTSSSTIIHSQSGITEPHSNAFSAGFRPAMHRNFTDLRIISVVKPEFSIVRDD